MELKRLSRAPTQDEFARLVVAEIAKTAPATAVDYDPAAFRITAGATQIHLGNLYADYLKAPRLTRRNVIRNAASLLPSSGETRKNLSEVLANVLPRVIQRAYFELMPYYAPNAAASWWPFAEDFAEAVVVDSPATLEYVNDVMLEELGVDIRVLRARALENLGRQSSLKGFKRTRSGYYVSGWRDNHDASRMLLVDLIAQLDVRGDPVAVAPNRDYLLICGDRDEQAQVAMLGEAHRLLEKHPRPISGRMLRLRERQWEPYLPSPGSDARAVAVALRNGTSIFEYGEQEATLMEHEPEKYKDDVWIAKLQEVGLDGEEAFTMAVWVEGAQPALMPFADQVYFGTGEDASNPVERLRVPWADAVSICGRHLEMTITYPLRYLVSGFPDEGELSQLREVSLPMWPQPAR